MRKALLSVLTLVLALILALGLTSCFFENGEKEHGKEETCEHEASDWIIDEEATCGKTGSKHKECTKCEEILETKAIDKLEAHTPAEGKKEKFVDSDCETKGSYDIVVYCSICHNELERTSIEVAAKGHNYSEEWTVDLEPSCIKGSKSRHCLICDKADVTEISEIIPHNVVDGVCTLPCQNQENLGEVGKTASI